MKRIGSYSPPSYPSSPRPQESWDREFDTHSSFYRAIVENRADLIWLYLQAGAPLMIPLSSSQSGDDPGGLTALAKMIMRGIEKDILKEAIESAITQCGGIEQFLQQIAELPSVNWIPLVRIVPENALDLILPSGQTLLEHAIDIEEYSLALALIRAGADLQRIGSKGLARLLKHAVTTSDVTALDRLLTARARPNSVDWLLESVIKELQLDVLKVLERHGFDIGGHCRRHVPLIDVVSRREQRFLDDQDAMLQYLIEQNASVDQKDGSGYSALATAVTNKNLDAVEVLLETGADPDTQMPDGQSVFSYAIDREYTLIAKALFQEGAEVTEQQREVLLLQLRYSRPSLLP
jgi:hypothetical protein